MNKTVNRTVNKIITNQRKKGYDSIVDFNNSCFEDMLSTAYSIFRNNPNTENYSILTSCMVAYQTKSIEDGRNNLN